MSYLVLARRFRPRHFDQVIGQEHITQTLKNALASGRVAHAFLFSGTRGVGKTTVARIMAKAINCLGSPETAPCNQCSSCLEIDESRSVDVLEIDGASNNSVDQVRDLRENAQYLPAGAKSKVYIIDEVHMLSRGAFNALLKTLEEPPAHVIFIFATTDVHKVPPTILSRCQRFDFRPMLPGCISAQLQAIAGQEGLDLDEAGAAALARAARGSMRDALSIFDQAISFAGRRVTEGDIQQILGLIDPRLVWNLAEALLRGQARSILAVLNEVTEHGYDLRAFYQDLINHCRNLIVLKIDPAAGLEVLGLSAAEAESLKAQAEAASAETLQLVLQGLLENERTLRGTTQPRIALELALLRLCHLVPVVGLEEIILKLDQLKSLLEAPGTIQPAPQPPAVSLTLDQEKPALAAPPTLSAGGTYDPVANWPLFLDHLRRQNPKLSALAGQTKARELTGDRLMVEQNSAFDALADPERRQELERLAGDFFRRPLKLTLVRQPVEAPKAPEPAPARSLHREALDHPLVKAAGDMFDCQVEMVKSDN